jgi:hypothetical protein
VLLVVAAVAALELPAWTAIAGAAAVALHLVAARAIGGGAGLAVSVVPVLLGLSLVLIPVAGGGACDPCAGGWHGVPLAAASLLGVVLLADIVAGPLWGRWRRR